MEVDLVEQIAELLGEMVVQVGVGLGVGECRPSVEYLQHLVRLLKQVTPQAGVGLLAVPRTLITQGPHQFVEASKLVGDGLGHLGEIQRGEMVGLEFAVEISPGDFDDALVGQPESLQDDRRGRRLLEASLISESTWLAWAWATRSGPVCPAAAVANT